MTKSEQKNNENTMVLDTHLEFKRLVNENIPPDQADAIIQVIKQVVMGSIASKSDIDNIGFRIKDLASTIVEDARKNEGKIKQITSDGHRKFEEKASSMEHRVGLRLESFEDELHSSEKKIKEMVEAVVAKVSRVQSSLPDKEEIGRQFEDNEIRISEKLAQIKRSLRGRSIFSRLLVPMITISNFAMLMWLLLQK